MTSPSEAQQSARSTPTQPLVPSPQCELICHPLLHGSVSPTPISSPSNVSMVLLFELWYDTNPSIYIYVYESFFFFFFSLSLSSSYIPYLDSTHPHVTHFPKDDDDDINNNIDINNNNNNKKNASSITDKTPYADQSVLCVSLSLIICGSNGADCCCKISFAGNSTLLTWRRCTW